MVKTIQVAGKDLGAQGKAKSGAEDAQAQQPRRSRRDKLMAMAMLWSGDRPDVGVAQQVLVSNISLEGVAVKTSEPLTKGSVYYVKMVAGPLKLETAIRVAWCRTRDGM